MSAPPAMRAAILLSASLVMAAEEHLQKALTRMCAVAAAAAGLYPFPLKSATITSSHRDCRRICPSLKQSGDDRRCSRASRTHATAGGGACMKGSPSELCPTIRKARKSCVSKRRQRSVSSAAVSLQEGRTTKW